MVVFVLTALVTIVSLEMRPVYQATARVEFQPETPPVMSLNDLSSGEASYSEDATLQTQLEVLKSENLARWTVEQLGLGDKAEFAAAGGGNGHSPETSLTAAENVLIQAFREHLLVQLLPGSRIIEVTFESTDPQLTARVANALVNNYTEYNSHRRSDATRGASGLMAQQLDELKGKVERAQQALTDYERNNLIFDLGARQALVEQRLAALSTDLLAAQSDRTQKQSLYEVANSRDSEAVLASQDSLLQSLGERYSKLREEYVDTVGQYGPDCPKAKKLEDLLDGVQTMMDHERQRVITRIHNDYMAAQGRESLLAAEVAHQKEEAEKLNQVTIQHNLLMREFEASQQLYASQLQHLKDATVSAGLRATSIHLVDSAMVPRYPVRPRLSYNIALSLLAGLLLGIMLAVTQESLDTSIKSVEGLEWAIGVPALAVVPLARSSWLKRTPDKSRPPDGTAELSVLRNPNSPLAEAYHILRTAIQMSTVPRPPQALMVTSASLGEGKTCTALNLAIGLAQCGARVALIDTDMRRPAIARALSISGNVVGLSTVLAGARSLGEVLRNFEPVPNLHVVPAGPEAASPAELLSSPCMQTVLRELRGSFEYLVLDSAPVLLVADAAILSSMVDGVVLVAESGVTPRDGLLRAQKVLESAGGRILGGVLNKWDVRSEGYPAYYGLYYGSQYHDRYGRNLKS
jgi:capsular exopolysaccharide synthesis family protein